MMAVFPDLPDTAALRVVVAEPALQAGFAADAVTAIMKLMQQFIREGRCTAADVVSLEAGRFVLIAWAGPPLSGCSHDKFAHLLATFESRSGCALLAPPPWAVGAPGAVRLVDRAGLKSGVASGEFSAATPVWKVRASSVGEWRSGPHALLDAVKDTPLAGMFTIQTQTPGVTV